ncbi:MAG: hypothetical protein EVA89_17205 [Sandaracinaceae bacterium]|nr:MAG: hypothetical protein EVA89_17205 [Sandaracinaceae bacterium]
METTGISEPARRSYTAEEWAEVLQDAASMGVCAAARKHGVPQPTISGWRRAAEAVAPRSLAPARSAPPTTPRTGLSVYLSMSRRTARLWRGPRLAE